MAGRDKSARGKASIRAGVQCSVNLDGRGDPASIIAVVIDMTERKNAERLGEAKLSELLGRTTDFVLMLDRNWIIHRISRHATELLRCSHEPKGALHLFTTQP